MVVIGDRRGYLSQTQVVAAVTGSYGNGFRCITVPAVLRGDHYADECMAVSCVKVIQVESAHSLFPCVYHKPQLPLCERVGVVLCDIFP